MTDEDGRDVMGAIRLGDRLYTPRQYLEQAMLFRAEYDPTGLKGGA